MSPEAADPRPFRVLFIGNSFTTRNNLPKLVADLAKAAKVPRLEFETATHGGWTFAKHWERGKVDRKIAAKKWDWVVLQDQSLAAFNRQNQMFEYARRLDAEIKEQGARTLFYMTWARRYSPEGQDVITAAYRELGRVLNADVAPVGLVWQRALQADKNLVLHAADQSHPNRTGSYLAACVLFAMIYDKSPEGLPGKFGNLSDKAARPLQTLAWKLVQEQNAPR